MTQHHWPGICFGAASGFSLTGLANALAHMNLEGWLAFAGSAASAAAGWYISQTAERARAEQLRQLTEAIRQMGALQRRRHDDVPTAQSPPPVLIPDPDSPRT